MCTHGGGISLERGSRASRATGLLRPKKGEAQHKGVNGDSKRQGTHIQDRMPSFQYMYVPNVLGNILILNSSSKLFIVDLKFKLTGCPLISLTEYGNPTLRSGSHSPAKTPALPGLNSFRAGPSRATNYIKESKPIPNAAFCSCFSEVCYAPRHQEFPRPTWSCQGSYSGTMTRHGDTKPGHSVLQLFPGFRIYSRTASTVLKTGDSSMTEQIDI